MIVISDSQISLFAGIKNMSKTLKMIILGLLAFTVIMLTMMAGSIGFSYDVV